MVDKLANELVNLCTELDFYGPYPGKNKYMLHHKTVTTICSWGMHRYMQTSMAGYGGQ